MQTCWCGRHGSLARVRVDGFAEERSRRCWWSSSEYRETMEKGEGNASSPFPCLTFPSSILNPGPFISPFTMETPRRRVVKYKETRYVIAFSAATGVVVLCGGLKQTARNLCIHLAVPERRVAASFRGLQARGVSFGGWDRRGSKRPVAKIARPRTEYATWRRRRQR